MALGQTIATGHLLRIRAAKKMTGHVNGHGLDDSVEPSHGASVGDQKIRIAIVLPALGAGGSERVVSLIANSWTDRGCKVAIVTFERPDAPAYYELDPRIELVRLGIPNENVGQLRGAWRAASRVRQLRRQLLGLAPNIVISFLTRANILTLLATWGTGIPVVVSERNNPELQTFGPVWTWMRTQLYPRAFGLVTMTKGAMNLFPPEQRVRSWVIPNESTLPVDLQARRGRRIFTAVGRLVPQKGFDLLLEAFARAAAAHPDWTLVIWGEGPEREKLEWQRRMLGLEGRVQLPGVSERPGTWIETADAFVLSSRFEGWGIVLLEAMAAGLPVISFDCRFGPSDMITHGKDGLLVPDGDIAALSAGMSRLMEDETMRGALGEAAAKSAHRFSRERVMTGWDEVVLSAVGQGADDTRLEAPLRSHGAENITATV